MADWGWVATGFAIAYVGVAVYVWSLRARAGRVRRQLEELRQLEEAQ